MSVCESLLLEPDLVLSVRFFSGISNERHCLPDENQEKEKRNNVMAGGQRDETSY